MKRLNFVLLGLVSLLFIGCGYQPQPYQKFKGEDVKVMIDEGENNSVRFTGISFNYMGSISPAFNRILELKEAANYARVKGFNYFIIDDEGFSNIVGTPVTTITEFLNYCNNPTASRTTFWGAGTDCLGKSFRMDIVFFKEKPKGFPVWSVEMVEKEIIPLKKYKSYSKVGEYETKYYNIFEHELTKAGIKIDLDREF